MCCSPSRRGQRGLASGSREASQAIILGDGGGGTTKPPFGNQLLSLQAPWLWDGQGLALQTGPPSGRSGGGILLETRRERTVLSPSHPVGPHERPPSRSGVSRAWVVQNLSPSPSPRKGLSRLQEHCNPPPSPPPRVWSFVSAAPSLRHALHRDPSRAQGPAAGASRVGLGCLAPQNRLFLPRWFLGLSPARPVQSGLLWR